MSTTAQIRVEEYLSTVYEPECDYVDGELEDRHGGEKDHSKLQFKIQMLLSSVPGLCIFPEVRIRVSETRYRVPDVSVYLIEPAEQVFTTPPYLVIEILSPEDRMSRMNRKLQDYANMGCPNIWIFNPDPTQRRSYRYESLALVACDGKIATSDRRVSIPLSELW